MTARKVRPAAVDGTAGRALRDRLTTAPDGEELIFSAAELVTLDLACAQADSIADLEATLAREGIVVTGSKGQPKLSQIVAELRLQRAALARLVGSLAFPEDGEDVGRTVTQRKAQKAADARWARQASKREVRRGPAA